MKKRILTITLAIIVILVTVSCTKNFKKNDSINDPFEPNSYTDISAFEMIKELMNYEKFEEERSIITDINELGLSEISDLINDIALISKDNEYIIIAKAKEDSYIPEIYKKVDELLNLKGDIGILGSQWKYVYGIKMESEEQEERIKKKIYICITDDKEWLDMYINE
ncbi:hypothetical protein [Niameybacter massiliensis]|uniref:hypothetical protein n=1 Tax=Niameybacter massiliensis TaxID=1658108 RepID=UPI0006B4CA8B|nr:hypothetical protein [Niameybacter massiliensis]